MSALFTGIVGISTHVDAQDYRWRAYYSVASSLTAALRAE
jgi:hypothetical protein